MQTLYTRSQLENFKLVELKVIAVQIGAVASDRRKKESWIEAILSIQPSELGEVEVIEWYTQGVYKIKRTYSLGITERQWLNEGIIFQTPSLGWVYKGGDIRCKKLPEILAAYREHLALEKISREQKSQKLKITASFGNWYQVYNPESRNMYRVNLTMQDSHKRCSCPDSEYRGIRCKHQIAVESYLGLDLVERESQALIADYSWVENFVSLRQVLGANFESIDDAIASGAARKYLEDCSIELEQEEIF